MRQDSTENRDPAPKKVRRHKVRRHKVRRARGRSRPVLNEIARIIAVGLALLAGLVRRAYRGLRFLVRRAGVTRATTAASIPGGGRLLDIAALSVAADLLLLAEWWRRSTPSAGLPALIGLAAGVVGVGLSAWLLRDRTWPRFLLSAVEFGRLGGVTLLALTSATGLAVGVVIGLGLLERSLWTVSAPPGHRSATASAAARYVGALLVPVALTILLGLLLGGRWALLLAQAALLVALIVALTLPPAGTPKAKPPKQRPPSAPIPSPAEPVEPTEPTEPTGPTGPTGSAAPDGSYHLYRPTSMNGSPPPDTP